MWVRVANLGVMKCSAYFVAVMMVVVTSCSSVFSPEGWPVAITAQSGAVKHMTGHVKFTGSSKSLTKQEKALLTFLDSPKNVADAIGEKNREGAHQWSTAEVYRVEPGKRVSVLCENGYSQKAVYFQYTESEKTWYRVMNLEQYDSRGTAAVIVQ